MNAILPIRPKWTELIFSGEKTIEVRKGWFRENIKKIYIYETAPVSAIVGEMKAIKYETTLIDIKAKPSSLAKLLKQACLTEEEFWEYIGNRDKITFFEIGEVSKYDIFIKMEPPPQSICYIERELGERKEKS